MTASERRALNVLREEGEAFVGGRSGHDSLGFSWVHRRVADRLIAEGRARVVERVWSPDFEATLDVLALVEVE